ncbi:MAG: hypothetical protein ACLUVC_08415 [Longibaculum sp.]
MTDVRQDYDLREVCEMLIEEACKKEDFIENYKSTENGKSGEFTKIIIELLGNILKNMSNSHCETIIDINNDNETQKNNIEIQKEYYRIDLIGWTQRKDELVRTGKYKQAKNFNSHMWDLNIAIEHENSSKDWLDEVVKLLYINCPRRLVIGYVNYNKKTRDIEANDKLYLDCVLECLNSLDKDGTKMFIKKDDQFGILLGNAGYDDIGLDKNQTEEYYKKVINYRLYFIKFIPDNKEEEKYVCVQNIK